MSLRSRGNTPQRQPQSRSLPVLWLRRAGLPIEDLANTIGATADTRGRLAHWRRGEGGRRGGMGLCGGTIRQKTERDAEHGGTKEGQSEEPE